MKNNCEKPSSLAGFAEKLRRASEIPGSLELDLREMFTSLSNLLRDGNTNEALALARALEEIVLDLAKASDEELPRMESWLRQTIESRRQNLELRQAVIGLRHQSGLPVDPASEKAIRAEAADLDACVLSIIRNLDPDGQ